MIYLVSALMIAAGIGFIYYLLRPNGRPWPADALQWVGTILSMLLIASASLLVFLTLRYAGNAGQVSVAGIPEVEASELNQPAAGFSFRMVSNDDGMNLADFEGKVVLLNFWATWCAPCLMEIPDLNRLQEAHGEKGLVVLMISDETREDLLAFQEKTPLKTYQAYIKQVEDLPQPFRRTMAVRPTTYVIDRQGMIRSYAVGAQNFDSFETAVLPYLEEGLAAVR